ncbi:hypothetical protein Adt_45081 [Abeliophyllum distichum]|uniref:Aminotransferase-like plant mobile domain-containing protein n=1 Tax=Abeliophyllum distichum TaxID=126358 RepID=A0ABD1PCQ5_9LAMI
MAGHDIGSIKYAFPGHFLYAWAATYFLRGIYSNIDKSIGRPIIRRYAGTLNDLQPWEVDMFDCRELVRRRMDLNDFCWNPIHLPPQCGIRKDKDDRSTEISEFMTSIRPGFLSYRRGSSSYILEAYNPHRFGRQQGFRQKLPGLPKDMNLKRALDIPNGGGPKRLKFTFTSTRNVPSSERVEKIPGNILVSEDSNSGDQASRGLEATLVPEDSSSEDQNNKNLDIIDALDVIDGLNGSKDLPCDYPSHISGDILASNLAVINDEGEVNSGTSVVKIPENEQEAHVTPSSLSLIVVPTSNINNRGIAPICSSMSGLPFGITENSSLLKDVFQEAMTKYLKKSFTDVIKHGFSNLRTWWAKSNQRLQNLITESFQTDPAPLTRRMEVFLKRVDAYLSKRKQILECPTLE